MFGQFQSSCWTSFVKRPSEIKSLNAAAPSAPIMMSGRAANAGSLAGILTGINSAPLLLKKSRTSCWLLSARLNAPVSKPILRPLMPAVASQRKPASVVVRSDGSCPQIAAKTNAASSTERVIGPILSIVQLRAIAPARLTRPNVGRRPVVPHAVQGLVMLPYVSVPIANGRRHAATADALPALEPLEPFDVSHGVRVVPPNQTSPIASSPKDSFATRMAPASLSLFTTVASVSNC